MNINMNLKQLSNDDKFILNLCLEKAKSNLTNDGKGTEIIKRIEFLQSNVNQLHILQKIDVNFEDNHGGQDERT